MATFTNTASLEFNGNTIRSNTVTGEITDVLTVTKTPATAEYANGSEIAYAISIINSGTDDVTGLTVTDTLGAYDFNGTTLYPLDYTADSVQYFVDGVLQAPPAVSTVQPLVITGITVPAGGSTLLLYTATVNSFAPLETGSQIVNTAEVTGEAVFEELTASSTITASAEPQLSIIKSLNPETVTGNQEITYTLTIQNTGNTAVIATDEVVLNDLFDPIITLTDVTFNGATWRSPAQYNMDPATGAFSTVAGQITVPAATYTQDPDTGEWQMLPGTGTLIITGTI